MECRYRKDGKVFYSICNLFNSMPAKNSMKTLLIIAAVALSGCAGHSITYNGTFGRYTIDRKGRISVEAWHIPVDSK
jgi:hypothetical protein